MGQFLQSASIPRQEEQGKETGLEVVTPEGAQSLQGHTLAPSFPPSLPPYDKKRELG